MEDGTRISDWNEANLKMKRLNDIQERINFFKRDPKGFIDGRFNYESWAKDVDVLYGEGDAKYTAPEIKACDELKKKINDILRNNPPHSKIVNDGFAGKQKGFIIDEEKYYVLIELIEQYERLVKNYNDKHGLSTRNQGSSRLF